MIRLATQMALTRKEDVRGFACIQLEEVAEAEGMFLCVMACRCDRNLRVRNKRLSIHSFSLSII